jgi:hypothetical protein
MNKSELRIKTKEISKLANSKHKNRMVVYALVDPIESIIRYVGKTEVCYEKRFKNHLINNKNSKTAKYFWINKLKNKKTKPIIRILSVCIKKETLNKKEIFWIKKLNKLGFSLLNGTEGGNGGVQTADIRKKMSIKQKQYFSNPKNREKLSKIHKERYAKNPELRKKTSENKKKHFSNLKNRQLHAALIKRTYTKELRIKHSDIQKEKWKDLKYRKKHLKLLKKNRENSLSKRKKTLKIVMSKREYREKAAISRGSKSFHVFKSGKYIGSWFSKSLCSEDLTGNKRSLQILRCLRDPNRTSHGYNFKWKIH